MAKVFRLTLGSIDRFAVAEDYDEMYEKRAEIEPTFAYTPVEIQELQIPGYELEAHEIKEESKQFDSFIEGATKTELTEYLEEKDIEVKSKATLKELKELAYQNV
ncbi:hypothetical protein ABE244_27035 [Bacillus toyonensis]|uniref:hypothetical protein n=1 Tax=Bacillus toyonensis TaxID=155322 RepID=UPI003D20067F